MNNLILYKMEEKAFVIPHLGLGDLFTCNGLIRSLREKYNEVKVVVLHRNLKNAKLIFSDDPSVTFFPVHSDTEISVLFGCPVEHFKKQLTIWLNENKTKRIVCFSHSFGTYILIKAFEAIEDKSILKNVDLIIYFNHSGKSISN